MQCVIIRGVVALEADKCRRNRPLWTHRTRRQRRCRALLAVAAVVGATVSLQVSSLPSASARGSYQLLGEGLDSCAAPSLSQMAAFWNNSPWYYWGIYIGGDERGCSQPNLTSSWITTVMTGSYNGVQMAWKLLPIWAGPQDPCQPGFGHYISYDTSTAHGQGETQGADAYSAWVNGLGQSSDTPIVYDMQYTGGTITSKCLAAMKAFINGWVYQLHLYPPQKAGLYTSSKYGDLNDFASISHPPDFIYGANYSSGKSTSDMPGVSSTNWAHQQRHKQYRGGHYETGYPSVKVDSDCANSWVYATYEVQNTTQGCSG
jgi:hypothetical protein